MDFDPFKGSIPWLAEKKNLDKYSACNFKSKQNITNDKIWQIFLEAYTANVKDLLVSMDDHWRPFNSLWWWPKNGSQVKIT